MNGSTDSTRNKLKEKKTALVTVPAAPAAQHESGVSWSRSLDKSKATGVVGLSPEGDVSKSGEW